LKKEEGKLGNLGVEVKECSDASSAYDSANLRMQDIVWEYDEGLWLLNLGAKACPRYGCPHVV